MNSGKIYKLVEKPQEPVSNLALVGLYYIKNPKLLAECLHNLIVNNIRTRGEFQLTDALMMMIDRGEPMGAFAVEGWYDCGKPETLLETNRFLLSQNKKQYTLPGVVINEPVYISDSAMVTNSVIGPYVSVGDGVAISDSIVKNSIVADNAEIRSSILTDSLLGSNSIIKGRYRRLNSGDSTEIDFN
jgi:glucose-1-phosphate thymidylyltransferase